MPSQPGDDRTEISSMPGWSKAFTPSDVLAYASVLLHPGSILGGRYEILQALGEGGMGSVFKARDREVDRVVALKVIRPELAGSQEMLQRFRQELVLASKITHRNVVRIYDLGLADGMRFISMEYIDGRELMDILRQRGKLPVREAAEIMLQVCKGLSVAHAEGVIHRDLKPQNIMVDNHGRAAVMDFGIAHSLDSKSYIPQPGQPFVQGQSGLTVIGALLGTPRYMSPEQARSRRVDARSDLFTVGLIFYELLTGEVPGSKGSLGEVLKERSTKQIKPPAEVDASIPRPVSDIVGRCLQLDPEHRYQSADKVVEDLETWLGIRKRQSRDWRAIAAIATLFVLLLGALTYTILRPAARAPHSPVKILVSDFANKSGNPVLNNTLEPLMNSALEGASFVDTFDRARARNTLSMLSDSAKLDVNGARLIAQREGLGVVVGGTITREGSKYVLSAQAINSRTGKIIDSERAKASSLEGLKASVAKVGAGLRKALGDVVPQSQQLEAEETFSATSLEAAQQYELAQGFQVAGKSEDALNAYKRCIALDPDFGRAYAGIAAILANHGQRQEAEKYYRLAMSKMTRMTEREKYRTRGGYYLHVGDYDKAIEQFTQLEKQYPFDSAGMANMAMAYFEQRNMSAALDQATKVVDLYPDNLLQLNNLGLYAMYAGDFNKAIAESERLLKMSPRFEKAYLCLALSQFAKGDAKAATETYHKLAALSESGASTAAVGLADIALYQGRAADAISILKPSIEKDEAAHEPGRAAEKRVMMGQAWLMLNQKSKATAAAREAVNGTNDQSLLYPGAVIYLESGEVEKALQLSRILSQRFEPDPRAYGKLIEAEVQMRHSDFRQAVQTLEAAKSIADTWMGRFDLGRAYLDAGAYTEADTELDACMNRKGEATSLFLDDEPTWRYFVPMFYYQGRAHQELLSPAAAIDYRNYLAARGNDPYDRLAADARKRLNSLDVAVSELH
ncbi:MAG: protein kinase [Acidobacteriaceae bacterium]|nr:protein kinase [Acidobacteriaceae bacterium]